MRSSMTQSLLQGKRFYCREWAFAKIQHCLETRSTAKTCGALIMGGPGSGKTVLCCEVVWPTSNHGRQRNLRRRLLAYHFCQAHDVDTMSVAKFVQCLVQQVSNSELVPGYAAKLQEPEIQLALEVNECETNPDEAFKKAILFPLLEVDPPKQTCFILVDSIDESLLQVIEDRMVGGTGSGLGGTSRSIAELLANHHQLFPQWLLLFCSSRRQSKSVNKLFTGFRKISLDDLHKTHVVRDVQQYILSRLDQEEQLRQHLSRETAEMLNQLHIKSNGCFLYLETVLNGVTDNFIVLREVREIPGTLNGLYLWLCQRLFNRKQFAKVQPILNVLLAARRPVPVEELLVCIRYKWPTLSLEDFQKRLNMLNKLLLDGKDGVTKILFHHSFAEWLVDVKHCTQKYLCHVSEGHALLSLRYTLSGSRLTALETVDFVWHLSRVILPRPFDTSLLSLWLVQSGVASLDIVVCDPKSAALLSEVQELDVRGGTSEFQLSTSVEPLLEVQQELDPLEELLASGVQLNHVDGNQRTLLHNVAHDNDVQMATLLIRRGLSVELVDKNGQTALNLAARQGNTDIVRLLLEASANPDHADNDGWTPLRSSAWGGHTDVVTVLLEHGAQVDLADADQRTALRAAAWGGHEDIVCKLLDHQACVNMVDNEGRTALIAAAYMGHGEIVDHLLKHGADVDHQDQDGRTALSVAALCVPASVGHARVVDILLENGAEVDHRDNDGMTPLLVAAFEGHLEVCEMLLEYDADVDHVDRNSRTPLFAAASMGHAGVVNLLLFFGAAIDSIDAEGRTVLSVAAAQGNVDVVRQLLDRGLDEMHRDNSGWTPLHYAAFEGHREACDALIEAGARVNETDNDGKHALILAAQEGHLAVVKLLMEGGATIDHLSHDGKTAFRVAALEGHREVVAYLLEQDADVNYKDADGRSTLYLLALEDRLSMASFLLEFGADVECVDLEGRSPLHVASWQDHRDMVELLLNSDAMVDSTDHDQRTALQLAAWQGHDHVVRTLIVRGACVDHTCNQGATALCIAAQEGHEDVVRLLLENGADPGHADQFGRSPARVASKCGHNNVVQLLEEYGGGCGGGSSAGSSLVTRSPGQTGVTGSRSTTSMASCSTAETKPCSAILCQPGGDVGNVGIVGSLPVSPESTFEKRRSFVSDPLSSSSKSSGNLTTSTKSSHASGGGGCSGLTDGHEPVTTTTNMSFTQQLQQCTRVRHRPPSKLLSPLGEPVTTPVQSPSETGAVTPSSRGSHCLSKLSCSSPLATSTVTSSDFYQPRHPWDVVDNVGMSGRSGAPPPIQMLPMTTSSSHFVDAMMAASFSPEAKLRRNGIVTNPNYKNVGNNSAPAVPRRSGIGTSVNGNQLPHIQMAHKQHIKTLSYDTSSVRHAGAAPATSLKKETPL